ncbi:Gmad2 immunoglobulin-like domain-containing protein [Nocardioides sp. R-C-SC26]|uniref:Gmad2 immunoglobulin-like domain-containing protein n=1 Tax=Nocardioides sp. R-C-SC26 TaxID=2870414 RepID=UPI001E4D705C|nr:Gmad2 immunoglobulin-like domain-containing protein [Nocardioides sp. R-C-SC26]
MRTSIRTATAALSLPLALAVLTACGDDTEPTATDGGTTSPSNSASGSPTPSASENATGGGDSTVVAPVYFVTDTPMGARLAREFRRVDADDPLEEAAELLVDGDALDPDYRTLLGGISIDSIEHTDAGFVVELDEDSMTSDKAMSPGDAALAVQSLVYTLQGTDQERDPVLVTVDGTPVRLFEQPTDTGVQAADQLDVLSLVNITVPESGATLSGTFTAEGLASSFEATVPWEIRDADDAVVLDGFSTAEGWMDGLYPWTSEVDVSTLAPGEYTFIARTDDPSDGEGPGPFEDTKVFTVS